MLKFKSFLLESNNGHSNLVNDFLNDLQTKPNLQFYKKRDNCGPACSDLISYAKKRGIELKRVRGEFHGDSVVHDKKDFTSDMKNEFKSSGLDFNNASHRKQWLENHPKYKDEWKKIPHYWTVDNSGNIHDPTGNEQIIKTGLSSDLNKNRYHSN